MNFVNEQLLKKSLWPGILFLTIVSFPSTSLATNPTLDQDAIPAISGISPISAVVDASGAIFISGDSTNPVSGFTLNRFAVAKVKPDLTPDTSWGTNGLVLIDVGVPLGQEQRARGIAIDSSGNVYVTGRAQNGFLSYYTVKLGPTGTLLWTPKIYSGTGDNYGECVGVKSDGSLVYVAGSTTGSSNKPIVQYNSAGTQLLTTATSSGPGVFDPCTMAVGSDGSLYSDFGTKFTSAGAVVYGGGLPITLNPTNLDSYRSHIYGGGQKVNATSGVATGITGFRDFPTLNTENSKTFVYTVNYGNNFLIKNDFLGNLLWSDTLPFYAVALGTDSARRIYAIGDFGLGLRIRRYTVAGASSPQDPLTWAEAIVAGVTPIRATHVTELRTKVNGRRGNAGALNYSWSSSTISAGNAVTAAHFNEMRTAISEVYTNCGQAAPPWSSGVITPGTSTRKVHIDDLRIVTSDAPACGTRFIFVTSSTYNGNLGGLAGADAKCQTAATAGSLPGTYKAWLSDGTGIAGTRLTSTTLRFILPTSGQIARDFDDLTDSLLDQTININELGATVANGATVWTSTDGEGGGIGNNCTNWTSGVAGPFGAVGLVGSTTSTWTFSTTVSCTALNRLYCVQQ